ncbi:hypothetical protein GS399_10955 [Pedobacter sp. HMF7647]|uniref:Zinc finger CGNR domain-containing protein n=1 Tax=Hufsiella arboris TaxID=2695275 RepID=A0A7K1YBM6_9SPHI|nr:CGNR zinc finger domain-containing protein [Hufsiella arboris]MXV51489.1 hypothetical protein [Hufsiella arboris]
MKLESIPEMKLVGGAACLDFINSGYNESENLITERLHSYQDLLLLIRKCGLINEIEFSELKRTATASVQEAERILAEAIKVRTVFYRVFFLLTNDRAKELDNGLLKKFNKILNEPAKPQYTLAGNQLALENKDKQAGLRLPLDLFIRSASDLLTNKNQRLIKKCCGCEWFFLDETKNHSRKWCDMQDCGSIAKSKRYYHRKKDKKT